MDSTSRLCRGPAETGLVSGTRVETGSGWVPVETVAAGDRLYVLDGSQRQVRHVHVHSRGPEPPAWLAKGLVLVPGGALDNCEDFYLLPDTLVLLGGTAVEALTGDSVALVRAADLVGFGGIQRAMPVDGVDLIELVFGEEEVVYANTGVLIHCPGSDLGQPERTTFPRASARTARALMACRDPLAGGRPARAVPRFG